MESHGSDVGNDGGGSSASLNGIPEQVELVAEVEVGVVGGLDNNSIDEATSDAEKAAAIKAADLIFRKTAGFRKKRRLTAHSRHKKSGDRKKTQFDFAASRAAIGDPRSVPQVISRNIAPALPHPTRASLKKERDAAIIKAEKSEKEVIKIKLDMQSIHSSHAKCRSKSAKKYSVLRKRHNRYKERTKLCMRFMREEKKNVEKQLKGQMQASDLYIKGIMDDANSIPMKLSMP